MKKVFQIASLLLMFAAMAIGTGFANTPAQERDDGSTVVAYNFISPAEVQLHQQIGTLGANYLDCLPDGYLDHRATTPKGIGINIEESTAIPRQYWPSGNSKASCKAQDGLNYYNISVSHKISDWPTSCSIARTCSGIEDYLNITNATPNTVTR